MGAACRHLQIFYESVPYLYTFFFYLELIWDIFRMIIYFSPLSTLDSSLKYLNDKQENSYYNKKNLSVPLLIGRNVELTCLLQLNHINTNT
jgi:hypothetical protein